MITSNKAKTKAQNFIDQARAEGCIEIAAGIYLSTADSLIEEQKSWCEGDLCKNKDLTRATLWITVAGSESGPIEIDSAEDLLECFFAEEVFSEEDEDEE